MVAAGPGTRTGRRGDGRRDHVREPVARPHGPGGARLDRRDGRIVAKNPDRAVLAVLWTVARALSGGARGQGDDG